jgi:hypothetical protein
VAKEYKSAVELRELDAEIIEYLLSGYTFSDIVKVYKEEQEFEEGYTANRIALCQQQIRESAKVDSQLLIDLHIQFYEEAWQYFNEHDNQYGKNASLKAKEKLLGLHKETNSIEINNRTNVEIETEEQYDLTKLTAQEQTLLQSLIAKSQ